MAHFETTSGYERGRFHALIAATAGTAMGWLRAGAARYRQALRQRRDRQAFRNLLDKEDWVYRDIGTTRADVEHAARLPLSVNAAREIDRLRARSMYGR